MHVSCDISCNIYVLVVLLHTSYACISQSLINDSGDTDNATWGAAFRKRDQGVNARAVDRNVPLSLCTSLSAAACSCDPLSSPHYTYWGWGTYIYLRNTTTL